MGQSGNAYSGVVDSNADAGTEPSRDQQSIGLLHDAQLAKPGRGYGCCCGLHCDKRLSNASHDWFVGSSINSPCKVSPLTWKVVCTSRACVDSRASSNTTLLSRAPIMS